MRKVNYFDFNGSAENRDPKLLQLGIWGVDQGLERFQ